MKLYALEGLRIAKSQVHGKGIFATSNYKAGEYVFSAILNELGMESKKHDPKYITEVPKVGRVCITALGSMINHSAVKNNVKLIETKFGWELFARRDIKKGKEILVDYYEAPDWISKPELDWSQSTGITFLN